MQVYITVGSQEKVEFAVNSLGVPRDHIFNSRNDSFANGIAKATNGRGVDVVLNTLSGSLLHASWKCVAEFGKMVDITKIDTLGYGSLDMAPFLLNRSFRNVDLAAIIGKRTALFQR